MSGTVWYTAGTQAFSLQNYRQTKEFSCLVHGLLYQIFFLVIKNKNILIVFFLLPSSLSGTVIGVPDRYF